MATSKRKAKKLGLVDGIPHGLAVGDKFYVYGTEIGTVTSVEGTAPNGVSFEWKGKLFHGLPPGKADTVWEKVTKG